ncbi:MAG TPA: SIS domain-containing protein, partial [Terriglobales bacterium]|nr:SIS domain-containing protein [Terriglobales bacterium]
GQGGQTLAETLSQPQCWAKSLADLQQKGELEAIRKRFKGRGEWLFVGCGSSYYLAQSAAAAWSAVTGGSATAAPASELLLFPETLLAGSDDLVPVLISRSGRTTEVLRAAEYLGNTRKLPTVAITCGAGQPLEQAASAALRLPAADEQSTVMTRSFSSMLLAAEALAATVAGEQSLLQALGRMAELAEPLPAKLHARILEFVAANQFADYVYLGQGPFYGLACEAALKITEMSCSYAQPFHTLEFRHGPKAILGPEVLVTFLLSESGQQAELEVLEEVKQLGATTLVVTNAANERTRANADLLVEFGFDVPELARIAAYSLPGQLLGIATALKKGFNPDQPRNLSRVVVLDPAEKPQHATL